LQTGFLKLLHVLPPDKQAETKCIQNRVYFDSTSWHADPGKSEFVQLAQQAISTNHSIEFTYQSAQEALMVFCIQLYDLVAKAESNLQTFWLDWVEKYHLGKHMKGYTNEFAYARTIMLN
jgi:hypothetical protein